MARQRGRVDANHVAVVNALRMAGASVQSLADIGKGCPDLLVAFRGVIYLMEVKDGSKPPWARRMTEDEVTWIANWKAIVHVVTTVDEALDVIGIY